MWLPDDFPLDAMYRDNFFPVTGRFVYHPLLPLSENKDDPPVYADFPMLERALGAKYVRDSMIR